MIFHCKTVNRRTSTGTGRKTNGNSIIRTSARSDQTREKKIHRWFSTLQNKVLFVLATDDLLYRSERMVLPEHSVSWPQSTVQWDQQTKSLSIFLDSSNKFQQVNSSASDLRQYLIWSTSVFQSLMTMTLVSLFLLLVDNWSVDQTGFNKRWVKFEQQENRKRKLIYINGFRIRMNRFVFYFSWKHLHIDYRIERNEQSVFFSFLQILIGNADHYHKRFRCVIDWSRSKPIEQKIHS